MIAWLLLMGCGPNCQSTCNQIWRVCETEDPANRPIGELVNDCTRECEDAMRVTGELGTYDPDRRRGGGESIELENDAQAVAWMDCVWNYAPDGTEEQCMDLDPRSGFCAPI